MSKLIFTFQREWIEEQKKTIPNPIRKMEKFVKGLSGVKFLKSDYDSFTAELESEDREAFILHISSFVEEQFSENEPWEVFSLTGDHKDIDMDALKTKKASDFPDAFIKEKVEEATKEASKEPEKKAESEEAPKEAETVEEARAEETPAEQRKEAESEKESEQEPQKEEVAEEPKAEVAEEPKKKVSLVNEKITKAVEEVCASIPMRYAPELSAYMRELGSIVPMLQKMHSDKCIYAQNQLVSIDAGFGYTSYLQGIVKVLAACQLIGEEERSAVKEYVIENGSSKEERFDGWKEVVTKVKEMASQNSKKKRIAVVSIDITQWQSELASPTVLDYLKQIADYTADVICVFRVPFLEKQVLQGLAEIINNAMTVKTFMVAPISIENMVEYIKEEVKKYNCRLTDDCDAYIEQRVIQEKQDDTFFGYKTLDKMVSFLVYQKALLNVASGEASREIKSSDLTTLFEEMDLSEDPYEQLNNLIGIVQVKQKIQEIIVQIKTQQELAEKGKTIEKPAIHMMFTGNPGTGKTTVARILGKIMKKEGVLRKGNFFEIKGRDLCGRYVGETAPKTSTYCRDAYGSILFIDEAYGLYQKDMGRDYGKEAIQTLIAEMENHRDDFCVIFAGYQEEMEELLTANVGLESRIPYRIEFPNYTKEELVSIFFHMLSDNFEYDEQLKEAVENFFHSLPKEVMEDKSFSNARMVRNLYERAWGKAAYRRSLSGEEKIVLRKEDLACALEEAEFKRLSEKKGNRPIGFGN